MIENKFDCFDIDTKYLQLNCSGLDKDQCAAVKETRNVVVSAGAGSGKTTVLAARFAYLVEAKNIPVDKILTLTFTKKAAAEMKDRIFNGLKNHANGRDIKNKYDLDKTQPNYNKILGRAQTAVDNLDKAHVQTLDSYFSEIAKKGAHFYGIQPDFSLDDEKIKSMIEFKATKFVLEHLDNFAIKEFSQKTNIQNIAGTIFSQPILAHSTILNPIDFTAGLSRQKNCIVEEVSKIHEKLNIGINLVAEEKASKVKLSDAEKKFLSLLADFLTEDFPTITKENIENCKTDNLYNYLLSLEACAKNRSTIAKIFKPYAKEVLEELGAVANFIENYKIQEELTYLLQQFQQDVIQTKRQSGLLSFNDVSNLAYKILQEHQDIRFLEQQKFDAIMIDEFQDDNQLQCDVLLMLSDINEKYDSEGNYIIPSLNEKDLPQRLDTNKLFFVGDEKQSIYLFRGADVSVFRALKSRLLNLNLHTNYRSDPELIKGFNTIFGGYDYPQNNEIIVSKASLFMTSKRFDADKIPNYEAEYQKVLVPEGKKETSTRKITFVDYVEASEEDKENLNSEATDSDQVLEKESINEAEWVAREIHRLVEEEKVYKYSEIAILFRASGPASAYEKILLKHKIPYSTEIYKGFFSDGPINDILALLRLCEFPNDIHSYARFLHSPFINLTQDEMQIVLSYCSKNFLAPFSDSVFEALKADGLPQLLEKLLIGQKIYNDVLAMLKTEKLTKTISYLWYNLGYSYETSWNSSVEMFSSLYDILFELANQTEQKNLTVADFLDTVKEYEEKDKKLDGLDVILPAENSVNIMTIHASKGLEFPVVFVCAASYTPSAGRGIPITVSEKFGLLVKGPYTSFADKNLLVLKEETEERILLNAELRRLTYVAFTRSEKLLYLVGKYKGVIETEDKPAKRYEPHYEKTRSFVVQKEDSEKIIEYENADNIQKLITPLLRDYLHEEISSTLVEGVPEKISRKTAIESSPFNFIGNTTDFIAFQNAAEEEKNHSSDEKLDYIKTHKYESIAAEDVIIQKKQLPVYMSPSKIPHSNILEEESKLAYANPLYSKIDEIVLSTAPEGSSETLLIDSDDAVETEMGSHIPRPAFDFNNFGTIAHSFLEASAKKCAPVIKQNTISGLNGNQEKLNTLIQICNDMTERFNQSDLAQELAASTWFGAEYDFRSFIKIDSAALNEIKSIADVDSDGIIINGQIDLVYKNSSDSNFKYTIVDYKTNQTIQPEVYYNQLTCYRHAISKMLGCKEEDIRCVLYYLRFAKICDITENCNTTNLENAICDYIVSSVKSL